MMCAKSKTGYVQSVTKVYAIILIAIIALCSSACSQTDNQNNPAELSQYLGYTIADVERALNVELIDMSQYQNYENTFRAEKRDGEFDCIIDSTGTIIKIRLISSGREQFSILGVTSNLEDNSAFDTLISNGATNVFGPYWMCSNGVDAVYLDSNRWTIEKDSAILKEALLRVATEEAFSFEHEDSEGAYYIGNGQIIEYYYGSFARFAYDYSKLTSYQKDAANQIIDGRYVLVSGTVTAVNRDGSISVFCQDDEASQAAGLIWPMQGSANLFVVPQQENQLINISNNSTIIALGRINMYSYDARFTDSFDLIDTVIISINGMSPDIPPINVKIPGVFSYHQGNIDVPTESTEHPEPNIDQPSGQENLDHLMEGYLSSYPYTHHDEMTSTYSYISGEDDNVLITIVAYRNNYGDVVYLMDYCTETASFYRVPSTINSVDGDRHSVMFELDPYFDCYGVIEIIYDPNSPFINTIWAEIDNCPDTYGSYEQLMDRGT